MSAGLVGRAISLFIPILYGHALRHAMLKAHRSVDFFPPLSLLTICPN